MSAITDIYDFLTPTEDAIAAAFKANEIACFTPLGQQKFAEDEATLGEKERQDFQRPRPRLDIVLHPGPGKGILRPAAGYRITSGHLREKAWACSLMISVITAAEILVHRAYLARVLFLCDTLAHDANATRLLTHHFLQSIRCQGGTVGYHPQDGNFETQLTFDVDLSVKEDAWDSLDAQT